MRHLISVATFLLALATAGAAISLIPALGSEGASALVIPQAVVFVLSIAGLAFWLRHKPFGKHLLLGAWLIAVAAGVASTKSGVFVSLQTIIGLPVIVMLLLSFRKQDANGNRT